MCEQSVGQGVVAIVGGGVEEVGWSVVVGESAVVELLLDAIGAGVVELLLDVVGTVVLSADAVCDTF